MPAPSSTLPHHQTWKVSPASRLPACEPQYVLDTSRTMECSTRSAALFAGKGGDVEHIVGPAYSKGPPGTPYGGAMIGNVGNTSMTAFGMAGSLRACMHCSQCSSACP